MTNICRSHCHIDLSDMAVGRCNTMLDKTNWAGFKLCLVSALISWTQWTNQRVSPFFSSVLVEVQRSFPLWYPPGGLCQSHSKVMHNLREHGKVTNHSQNTPVDHPWFTREMLNTFLLVEMEKNKVQSRVVPYLRGNWRWGKACLIRWLVTSCPKKNFQCSQNYANDCIALFLSCCFEELDPIITNNGNKQFYIEHILNAWRHGHGYQYLVHWCSYGQEHDKWLPGSEMQDCEALWLFIS